MFDIHEETNWLLGDDLDPVLQMRMAMLDLAGEDRDDWLAPALSDRVVEVLELRERLEAEVLRLIGRWDRARAWETDGSLSARSWLEHRAALAPTEARRMAKTARLVDRHDLIAEALADGRTTVGHVDVLSRTVSKPREPLLGSHEPLLVDHATTLPVRDFAMVMRRWASYADDELAADTHEAKWERRHLHASKTLDGWGEVLGSFDPAGYAAILNAVDHLAPPDPLDAPDGPRSLAQRRADGLVDLATWYLGGARPSGNPPNLSLIVDVAALNRRDPRVGARSMRARRCRCGDASDTGAAGVLRHRGPIRDVGGIRRAGYGSSRPTGDAGATQGLGGPRSPLPIPRMPPGAPVVRCAPRHQLARRWPDRHGQSDPPVPAAPHLRPQQQVDDHRERPPAASNSRIRPVGRDRLGGCHGTASGSPVHRPAPRTEIHPSRHGPHRGVVRP